MEVSGWLHTPAVLPPVKEPLVPIREESGWAQRAGLEAGLKIKIPSPSRDSNPRSSSS